MLTKEQQLNIIKIAKEKNPNISIDEVKILLGSANTLSEQPKDKTWQQNVASKAPLVMGALGGTAGLPFGLAPMTGAASAGTGEIINQQFNPGPISSKYKFGEKVSKEDLPAFRQEKFDEMKRVLGTSAGAAFIFDIINGITGQKEIPGKQPAVNVTKKVINPKKTTMEVKDYFTNKSKSTYTDKEVLAKILDWNNKQKLTPESPAQTKKREQLIAATQRLFTPTGTRTTQQAMDTKASAWEKSYTPFGAKTTMDAKVNKIIGNSIKEQVWKNDKPIAITDKVYGILTKISDAPGKLLKRWTGTNFFK